MALFISGEIEGKIAVEGVLVFLLQVFPIIFPSLNSVLELVRPWGMGQRCLSSSLLLETLSHSFYLVGTGRVGKG